MVSIKLLYRRFGNPKVAIDYLKAKDLATLRIETLGGWANLDDEQRYYIIAFYANDTTLDVDTNNANKVGFLMGKGYSQTESIEYLENAYAKHHKLEKEASMLRVGSIKLTQVVAKYLNLTDARDFVETSKILYDLYKDESIKGTNDGAVGESLFDWIESTPETSYSTSGLRHQGYVLKVGTWDSFENEIMDILRNGNYY